MFTKIIALKQHTPIIHFQHGLEGSTLRATELKPKLDRFILNKLGNGNFEQGCEIARRNEWINEDNTHMSLDYKVTISASNRQMNDLPTSRNFPTFFGNMGLDQFDESKFKKIVFHEKIELRIFSFSNSLIEYIESVLGNFFFLNNFGNRQSKGFGSFYPEDFNKYKHNIQTNAFEINIPKGTGLNDKFSKVFDYVNLFYKTLRSGINQKDRSDTTVFYFKSLLYCYIQEKYKVEWDKKIIKKGLIKGEIVGDNHTLFRDLLGLSTEQDWLKDRAKVTKECTVTDIDNKPKIARFKSPITIKPINIGNDRVKIYVLTEKIDPEYLSNGKFKVKNERNRKEIKLTLPSTFDVDDFLNFAFKVDIEDHVDYDFQHRAEFEKIKRIYQQLKQSAK